ncbi:MAG TPA: low-specificity L-threonine aldolase [Thermoanaerobaculia bacterium]|nr:low-specificity L-threonine aldolase [Thermoanaerobaculia bacterium]
MSLPRSLQARIDLRSDTVTLPPAGMLEAIAQAPLGDDVYGEDPTVNRLEEMAAERLGKEAALLVTSGTQANLLAFLSHAPRGRKVLLGNQSDAWLWEAGGASVLGGLVYHPVPTLANGELDLDDLEEAALVPDDAQCAPPGVVCVENTHCLAGGRILRLDYLAALHRFADRSALPVHLDGARLFNAAVALGVDVRDITQHADSVSFCLSKGLSAPVGSLLAGPRDFILCARRFRKMLGGGMRQAGILAAAGIYALERMVDRLAEDHRHARLLYEGVAGIDGIVVDPAPPETNIVFWTLAAPGLEASGFIAALAEKNVAVGELGRGRIRAVTHFGVTREDIDLTVEAVRQVVQPA